LTEVLFYHLEQQSLEKVLPVLLEKSLERGWRAVVEVGSAERLAGIDQGLWTFRDDSFLPHAIAGQEGDEDQPILLSAGSENANGAAIRFYVDRAVPADVEGYARAVYIFDGHDPDAVAEARAAWKALNASHQLTYWQQDASGRWQKKA